MMNRTIYLSEILAFYRRKKNFLLAILMISSLISFLVVLLRSKPHFLAEATFRQNAGQFGGKQPSLQSIFDVVWKRGDETYALSVMQSKNLLGKVVEQMGWQVQEEKRNQGWTIFLRELGFSKKQDPFLFKDVLYHGETTQKFFIRPLTEDSFAVLDAKKKQVTNGTLNIPVQLNYGSWTLTQMPKAKKVTCFELLSKRAVLPKLQKNFTVKKSRQDSNLLELKLEAPQRQLAIDTLNAIMLRFQDHIKQEHEEITKNQISYLKKRREDLENDFDQTLTEHMTYLQTTLGTEGFLGLAEGWDVLSEPKEKYTTQKHNIDLDIRKWKTSDSLEASAQHPWKEGMQQKDEIDWQITKIHPYNLSDEEISKLDLETVQKLHAEYGKECDWIAFHKEQIKKFQERIDDPDFDVTLVAETLKDPVSHDLIKQIADLSIKNSDQKNYSKKERDRFEKNLLSQKQFLRQHLEKKVTLLQLQSEQITNKISCLEQHALELLRKEKGNIELKLAEIGEKMSALPEKWLLESRLKLKKELTLQILEGLTKLSESKVIDHHLFDIESKPLDFADAPLQIQPPHLILFASLGGISGTCFFAIVLLGLALYKGFPVSEEFLRDQKFQVASKQQALQKMALETKSGEVIALIGCSWEKELVKFLKKQGKENCITILSCPKALHTFEALDVLNKCDRFLLQLNDEKEENLNPYAGKWGICVLNK